MELKSTKSKILVIGGSGFVSGALARRAATDGFEVHVLTRGVRPLPDGVVAIKADRSDHDSFRRVFEGRYEHFDLVVDCICYDEEDAKQDVEVFSDRCDRFVFVSTDSVYDPSSRTYPQDEKQSVFLGEGYGARKRRAESIFEQTSSASLAWTVVRPCHIYGPGSHLGCIPRVARDPELVSRMRSGRPIELVGGGRSLSQPLFVDDLVDVLLACVTNSGSVGEVLNVAGPETIEARRYYEIIADALSVPLRALEVPFATFWDAEPEYRGHLCHRLLSLERLKAAGLPVPATPPEQGLPIHVRSVSMT